MGRQRWGKRQGIARAVAASFDQILGKKSGYSDMASRRRWWSIAGAVEPVRVVEMVSRVSIRAAEEVILLLRSDSMIGQKGTWPFSSSHMLGSGWSEKRSRQV